MNIIFAGTPAFSAVSLKALIASGHKIPLVITQPDRRAGRGMSMMPSEVKKKKPQLVWVSKRISPQI